MYQTREMHKSLILALHKFWTWGVLRQWFKGTHAIRRLSWCPWMILRPVQHARVIFSVWAFSYSRSVELDALYEPKTQQFLKLFHGPDQDRQRRLPYNHVRYHHGYEIGLMRSVRAGDRPRRRQYNYIEDQHWTLISWCWEPGPDMRPTIAQVREALWDLCHMLLFLSIHLGRYTIIL